MVEVRVFVRRTCTKTYLSSRAEKICLRIRCERGEKEGMKDDSQAKLRWGAIKTGYQDFN
jgi:hypothetical protein